MAASTDQAGNGASAGEIAAHPGEIAVMADIPRQHARSSLAAFIAPAGSVDSWQPVTDVAATAAEGKEAGEPGGSEGRAWS